MTQALSVLMLIDLQCISCHPQAYPLIVARWLLPPHTSSWQLCLKAERAVLFFSSGKNTSQNFTSRLSAWVPWPRLIGSRANALVGRNLESTFRTFQPLKWESAFPARKKYKKMERLLSGQPIGSTILSVLAKVLLFLYFLKNIWTFYIASSISKPVSCNSCASEYGAFMRPCFYLTSQFSRADQR